MNATPQAPGTAADTDLKDPVPAYVSYKTFAEFIGSLKAGVQPQVERVVWDSRLGDKTSAQLVTALKFLGLFSPVNEPTQLLYDLSEIQERADLMAEVLKSRYSPVLDTLATGTRGEFQQLFSITFGTSGDTTRKSVAFLLHAAMDAGLTISPHILKGRRRALSRSSGGRTTPTPQQSANALKRGLRLEDMDPALQGLLLSLPDPGPLDKEAKQAWKKAMEAVFDLVYPTEGRQPKPGLQMAAVTVG